MPFHGLVGQIQKVTYWPCIGLDAHNEPILDTPQELDARWDDQQQRRTDPKGNVINYDGCVAQLDRELAVHSIVWKGGFEDLLALTTLTDLRQVKAMEEAPDRKGRNVYREALFMRYHGEDTVLIPKFLTNEDSSLFLTSETGKLLVV